MFSLGSYWIDVKAEIALKKYGRLNVDYRQMFFWIYKWEVVYIKQT